MNTQLANFKQIAIFVAGIYTASIPAVAHADWSIKGLGFLGEFLPPLFPIASSAFGINDSGQVAGTSSASDGPQHAFITGPNGIGMIDLDEVGYSFALGINDSGQVAGESIFADDYSTDGYSIHAFITGPNGIGVTDLGTLGGSMSTAQGINNSGQVVGYSFTKGDIAQHAFITGPNGIGMTDLGTLLGGRYSVAYSINDSGQVVGSSQTAGGSPHAFITGPNGIGMTDLGTLGGFSSQAYGINDSGQVVGESTIASGPTHAFITGPNGIGMTDLGTLVGGYNISRATGINDFGEVVGVAGGADGLEHSFIFSHGGMTDLSLLAPVVADGWTNIVVNSINNNGQMVGSGQHHGHTEAFLLSYTPDTIFDPQPIYIPPVPEPEAYVMLLAGLGLMGYLARRREETFN
ncbi:PEP-CTERM sorting domain-containing protein [Nitrosomonas sp. sh817]|uniref:PEP-CTERM sorting domain-containing protein n=1 Tax=Nitrosomonas sp. sh817 TaxID=3070658 RepID=UPI0027DC97D5|nr:PEP-CTERM sorting domain-containing protein [Nitrosomonas sp. sh817]WMJ07824.1 PEP-CTERM sorting domain-containing protein [Nitrosomonas sp. sh817]